MKIAFVVPYPSGNAPSQRFRFEQYHPLLQKHDYTWDTYIFYSPHLWKVMYQPGHHFTKIWGIIIGYLSHIRLITRIYRYDFIFLHREATPMGPPFIEWLLCKVGGKKVIYDFDDAIWLEDPDEKGSLKSWLKYKQKIGKICRWSWKVSTGNAWLAAYARQFNPQTVINPTTIDTQNLHNPALHPTNHNTNPVIGWTGTHSTLTYLTPLLPILKKLEEKHKFTFLIIANTRPNIDLKSLQFIQWSKETEITDLMKMNIGIMPLTDDAWSQGKCGFKALQYMALEIPALVSPVGVNKDIVIHGENGFLCNSEEDWEKYLDILLTDEILRKKLGINGRKKIVEDYSVTSNEDNFLSLFDL